MHDTHFKCPLVTPFSPPPLPSHSLSADDTEDEAHPLLQHLLFTLSLLSPSPCLTAVSLTLCTVDTEDEAQSKPFVASMGIYVFKKSVLQDLLLNRFPKVGLG